MLALMSATWSALYFNRAELLEWMQAWQQPVLPEAVGYEEIGGEVMELGSDGVVEEEIVESSPSTGSGTNVEEAGSPDLVVDEGEVVGGDEDVVIEDEVVVEVDAINLAVPFTSQAPHANWDYPNKEAGEEASVFMVASYFEGVADSVIASEVADERLLELIAFEEEVFGYYEDTTVEQTALLAEMVYGYQTLIIENPTVESIKEQLQLGRPVIVPAAGRELGNPYFTAPGPVYHMLVIRGYTVDGQFITNDPGTRRGETFLYPFDTLLGAVHDYDEDDILTGAKRVLVMYP